MTSKDVVNGRRYTMSLVSEDVNIVGQIVLLMRWWRLHFVYA